MDYSWQVFMENMAPSLTRAVTFMSEGERPESRIDVVDASYVPFIQSQNIIAYISFLQILSFKESMQLIFDKFTHI
jgi:hypothetical protein